MRDVQFDDLNAFLAELSDERDRIEGGVVRCEVDEMEVNKGRSEVFVKAGFEVGDRLVQFVKHCGASMLGEENGEARELTLSTANRIDGACRDLGLKFKRGVFL